MEDVQCQLSQTLEHLGQLAKTSDHDTEHTQDLLIQANDKLDQLQLSIATSTKITPTLSQTLNDLVRQAQYLSSLVQAMPSQNQILRRLFYRSIFRREDEVITAEAETFRWIFDTTSDETRIVARLTSQQDGITSNEPLEESEETLRAQTSRVFIDFLRDSGCTLFVQGKAGCGKSTFMKYVAHHELTDSNLKAWAGMKKLVTIKVFFWRSDDLL